MGVWKFPVMIYVSTDLIDLKTSTFFLYIDTSVMLEILFSQLVFHLKKELILTIIKLKHTSMVEGCFSTFYVITLEINIIILTIWTSSHQGCPTVLSGQS